MDASPEDVKQSSLIQTVIRPDILYGSFWESPIPLLCLSSSHSVRLNPCTSSASPSAFMLQVNSPLLGSGKIWGSVLMADKTNQVATGLRLFLPMERLLSPACFLQKVSQNWVRSQPAVGSRKLVLPCVSQPLVQAQELAVEPQGVVTLVLGCLGSLWISRCTL